MRTHSQQMMHWLLAPQRAFWWWPFHLPSLACDPTTLKDLRKTAAKVFQPSFSGLPWTKGITELSYTLMGTAIRLPMHPMYIHLSTSIWTIKSYLNTQEIAYYGSLLIQNTPIKFHQKYPQNQAAKTTVHTDGDPQLLHHGKQKRIAPEITLLLRMDITSDLSTHKSLLTFLPENGTCCTYQKISCFRRSSCPVALNQKLSHALDSVHYLGSIGYRLLFFNLIYYYFLNKKILNMFRILGLVIYLDEISII